MSQFLLPLIASLAAAAVAGEPSLRWHETKQTLQAPPSAEQAAAAFSFVNDADHPVTITRIRSSCGCTVAALDKTVYQPGERGEIRVTFRFDDRVGRHTKRITVETDDPDQPRTALTLTVDIPQLLRLTPPTLNWTLPRQAEGDETEPGEQTAPPPDTASGPIPAAASHEFATSSGSRLSPQTVRIDLASDHPVRVLTAQASDPRFRPILESRIDDESMVMTVVPLSTLETTTLAWITLTTDMEEGRWHEVKVPLIVAEPRRRPTTSTASRSIRK